MEDEHAQGCSGFLHFCFLCDSACGTVVANRATLVMAARKSFGLARNQFYY